jgi:hypothetical protein
LGPAERDGVTYGIVHEVDGADVVYDKIDYLKKQCDGRTPDQMVSETDSNRICFSNKNAMLRRARLDPGAQIVGVAEDGAETTLTLAALPHYEQCCSGPDVWQMTLRRGVIVRMLQFNVTGE